MNKTLNMIRVKITNNVTNNCGCLSPCWEKIILSVYHWKLKQCSRSITWIPSNVWMFELWFKSLSILIFASLYIKSSVSNIMLRNCHIKVLIFFFFFFIIHLAAFKVNFGLLTTWKSHVNLSFVVANSTRRSPRAS